MARRGPWLKVVAVVFVVAIVVAGLTKGRFVPGIGVRWRRDRFGGGRSGGGGARACFGR